MRRAVALALVAAVFSMTVSAGVVPYDRPLGVEQTIGEVDGVQDVLVEGYNLTYTGTDISATTVYVKNTGTEITADVRVELRRKNGTVLRSQTTTALITAGTTEVSVSFLQPASPSDVTRIRILVAKSL